MVILTARSRPRRCSTEAGQIRGGSVDIAPAFDDTRPEESALVTYPWVVAGRGAGGSGWRVLVCWCGWSVVWQAILTASRWC